MSENVLLTIWTEAWMQGEGLTVQGIGTKELEDRLTVSANGREWVVVVILTLTHRGCPNTWKAIDEKRHQAWLLTNENGERDIKWEST